MYLVIGAGLAGVSAALTLQEYGAEVTVLESSDRVGGRVTSDFIDGFILDRGFQLININYPELMRWKVAKHLDFKIAPREVIVSNSAGQQRLGDPRSVLTNIFSSASGKIFSKILFFRYLTSTPNSNESVEDHFLRTGVADLYQKVLRPFLSGVFLADPSLVNAVVGRQVIGSFINGRSGVPAKGVRQLSEFLGSQVRDLRLNVQVEQISGGILTTSAGEFRAKKIIVATDATTAGHLLGAEKVCKNVGAITWYHAVEIPPSNRASLVVDSENRGPVLNSLVISNLAPLYAPPGQHLISSTTITHASESEVRRHLALIWGVNTETWRFLAKYDISSALPLFVPGPQQIVNGKFDDVIYRAGDYLSAPSQNGAMVSGRSAALELMLDEGFQRS